MINICAAQSVFKMTPTIEGRALSGAYHAYAEDSEAIYFNPASTWFGYKNDMFLTYSSWIAETSLFSAGYRRKVSSSLAIGMGFTLFTSGDIAGAAAGTGQFGASGLWENDNDVFSYHQYSAAANISYRFRIGRFFFPAGINVKTGSTGYSGASTVLLAADAGLLFPIHNNIDNISALHPVLRAVIPERVSIFAKDIGIELAPRGVLTHQPAETAFGAALGQNILTTRKELYNLRLDLNWNTYDGVLLGMINTFTFTEFFSCKLLGGINPDSGNIKLSGGTVGQIEIKGIDYTLGYVINSLDSLGISHQFSFSINFDFDIITVFGGKKTLDRRSQKILQEANMLIFKGNYREAKLLLTALQKKYRDNKQIIKILSILDGLEKNKDWYLNEM